MPADIDLLTGEDEFNAASLNDRFNELVTAINALLPSDVAPRAFEREHFNGSVALEPRTTSQEPASGIAETDQYDTFAVVEDDVGIDLAVVFPAIRLDTGRVKALFVAANIDITEIRDTALGIMTEAFRAVVRVAWYNATSATWTALPVSIRQVSQADETDTEFDIPVRCLITPSDTGSNEITGVRLEICGTDTADLHDPQITYKNARLSVIPMHCEIL